MTFREKLFMDSLRNFKREKLSEAREREVKASEWKKAFVAKYPRDSILSLKIDNYHISRKEGKL